MNFEDGNISVNLFGNKPDLPWPGLVWPQSLTSLIWALVGAPPLLVLNIGECVCVCVLHTEINITTEILAYLIIRCYPRFQLVIFCNVKYI